MPKKPWTPERRWQSLIEAGVVDAARSSSDLAYATERLLGALAPTMWEHVRARHARALHEHVMDLLARRSEDDPRLREPAMREPLERLLGLLRDSRVLQPADVRGLSALLARLLPDSLPVMVSEADLLIAERRYGDAERLLMRALALDPQNERAQLLARTARLSPHRSDAAS